ncbi:MAG: glycosyltransferase family 2 protein [Actinomycetota bacterium]|nr:glycosyltransferase family 2 protein [Actinomycetota bacterium]
MTGDDDPLISIITVNFNGKPFLRNLFNSIHDLDYPAEKIQMIMVDNNSKDDSVKFVEEEFPWVEVVSLKKNTGYAGGNNEGLKRAKGKYIALINNDCVVERGWLSEMLLIFRQAGDDSKIGAVGSKVLFYYPYLPVQLIASSTSAGETSVNRDFRRLGVKIYDVAVRNNGKSGIVSDNDLNSKIKYPEGFYPVESDDNGEVYRWTQENAILAIPVADPDSDLEIQFRVSSYISPNNLKIVVGGEILYEFALSERIKTVRIKIPKRLFSYCRDIINSCGIKINRSCYSKERGFECFDYGQYNRVEEVFGLSGSSFMMDRKMLEDVGYFDESFFTYYEDVDLFWRSKLADWKNFFTPKSVARHFHCGAGKEWSYSFTYFVVRNRLLMIFKCGWPLLFLRNYFTFVFSSMINILYYLTGLLRGKKQKRVDIPVRIRVFFELFYLIPVNLVKRIKIRKNSKIQDNIIKSWMRDF